MKLKMNSMETNADPSDEEIRKYMNFEKLVTDARQSNRYTWLRMAWLTIPVGLVLLSLWMVLDNGSPANTHDVTLPSGTNEVIPHASGDAPDATNERPAVTEAEKFLTQPSLPQVQQSVNAEPSRSTREKQSGARATTQATTPGYPAPDKPISAGNAATESGDSYIQAEPQQGYAQLYAYFRENLSYPKEALRDSTEGIETVSFIIDEQGKPGKIEVTHSLGVTFDQEALRLIREMPAWNPATLNGRPVASQLSVPLTFQVKRIRK